MESYGNKEGNYSAEDGYCYAHLKQLSFKRVKFIWRVNFKWVKLVDEQSREEKADTNSDHVGTSTYHRRKCPFVFCKPVGSHLRWSVVEARLRNCTYSLPYDNINKTFVYEASHPQTDSCQSNSNNNSKSQAVFVQGVHRWK